MLVCMTDTSSYWWDDDDSKFQTTTPKSQKNPYDKKNNYKNQRISGEENIKIHSPQIEDPLMIRSLQSNALKKKATPKV